MLEAKTNTWKIRDVIDNKHSGINTARRFFDGPMHGPGVFKKILSPFSCSSRPYGCPALILEPCVRASLTAPPHLFPPSQCSALARIVLIACYLINLPSARASVHGFLLSFAPGASVRTRLWAERATWRTRLGRGQGSRGAEKYEGEAQGCLPSPYGQPSEHAST